MDMDVKNLKNELSEVFAKYGYNVDTLCIDMRHGRSSHKAPTIELVLKEAKEEPRSFWID